MKDFLSPSWAEVLRFNGFHNFEAIWRHRTAYVEEPNWRRGGWSSVCHCILKTPQGQQIRVFIKRQENHIYRSFLHPIRGEVSLVREMYNIRRFQSLGIPGPEPIYFAQRKIDGNLRGILMTAELTGYLPLTGTTSQPWPRQSRRRVFDAVASVMRKMHRHRLQHNCFYPKHIFFKTSADGNVEIRIIDLEKAKWRPLRRAAMLRDLDTLNRHCPQWEMSDRLRFLKIYLGEDKLNDRVKQTWRGIARRGLWKTARKANRVSSMLGQKS